MNAFQAFDCSTVLVLSSGKVILNVKAPPRPRAAIDTDKNGIKFGHKAIGSNLMTDKTALNASQPRLSLDLLITPKTNVEIINITVNNKKIRPALSAE